MKKIVNKRPILLFAMVMIATVLAVIYHNFFVVKISLLSVAGVFLICGTIFIFFVSKNTFKYIFSRFIIFGIAVIVSLGAVEIGQLFYMRDYNEFSGMANVSARIAEVGIEYDGNKKVIILDNVHIQTDGIDKKLHYRAHIVVILDANDPNKFVVGSFVDAYCGVSFADIDYESEYGKTFNYVNKKISCYGFCHENSITVADSTQHLSLQERIQNKTEQILQENLDPEYVGLAQGMLFGDKSAINTKIREDFSNSGIAHLLAVSGLHVGFLVLLLSLILKLFRAKGFIKFVIISIILAFYAYLCGFTVSVVRASIMAICLLVANIRNQKYDSLNALALAGVIIVAINPYSVVTSGFVLSFVCVLSILLLAPLFTRVFAKFLYRKLASTIAVLLAVQIGTVCVSAYVFDHITLIGIISNFVCIPIASLAYMLLYVTTFLALIVAPFGIGIYLFQFVMQAVVKFVHLVAPYGMFELARWKGTALVLAQIPAMSVSSDYIFFKKPIKISSVIVLWVAFAIILFC